jgi:fatty acid desaturase
MAATSGSADAGRVAAAVIDSSDATPKQSIEQLKALLPPKEVADLSAQRSDSEGVQQAAFHFGLAAALAWLVVRAGPEWTWARVALMVALAFVESFFFMPLHECVHQSAFRSRWLNDAVALLCGLLTMRPPNHYRLYHYCHHRFTGDKARDPELQNTPIDPDLKTLSGYLLYLSGLPFWYDRTTTLAR